MRLFYVICIFKYRNRVGNLPDNSALLQQISRRLPCLTWTSLPVSIKQSPLRRPSSRPVGVPVSQRWLPLIFTIADGPDHQALLTVSKEDDWRSPIVWGTNQIPLQVIVCRFWRGLEWRPWMYSKLQVCRVALSYLLLRYTQALIIFPNWLPVTVYIQCRRTDAASWHWCQDLKWSRTLSPTQSSLPMLGVPALLINEWVTLPPKLGLNLTTISWSNYYPRQKRFSVRYYIRAPTEFNCWATTYWVYQRE